MDIRFEAFEPDRLTTAADWKLVADLRPVPCERRTVCAVAVSHGHQTEILAVDRLTGIETVPLGHQRIDDGLTLSEARKLAFAVLRTGFRSIARRQVARLRALFQ